MLRSLCRLALPLLASSPALAQAVCHAENDGAGFNDNVSMGGPNLLLAIRFTSPASFSVSQIEMFTGEGTGSNSVSVWTHDAASNKPGTPISPAGAWSLATANGWQGASLGSPASLASGTVYWVVWGCVSGSQASVDAPMTVLGQPYRGSFDGGVNWSGPFQFTDRHWKFRLYGSCGGSPVTPYCFGDGTLPTACPCGNAGTTGRGCQNSAGTGGALLSASGTTSPDALVLASAGELPSAPSLVLQGSTSNASGSTFGDGLKCVGGMQLNLYVKFASAGTAIAPVGADPSITVRSAAMGDVIAPGGTRYYQFVYRDPSAAFCPSPAGSTFNVSNGLTVVW